MGEEEAVAADGDNGHLLHEDELGLAEDLGAAREVRLGFRFGDHAGELCVEPLGEVRGVVGGVAFEKL